MISSITTPGGFPLPIPPSLDLEAILLGEDDSAEPFADEDLIPARMLNEFTYCPRLAYLEFVQGEFTDNLDTCQGTFGHRNVDKPSARHVPIPETDAGERIKEESSEITTESIPGRESDDEPNSTLKKGPDPLWASAFQGNDDALQRVRPLFQRAANCELPEEDGLKSILPQTTRALTLSAPREGLVAKLDVLELEGSVVTPVDYKKGSIPDNPHQAWEPERVQLCAQGLILRENGYSCDQGELYYIESRRRIVIPFDDALVMRTRELVKQLREMARGGTMPPPLVDSPKCPRCSLVGICLPDETNLLLREEEKNPSPTRQRGDFDRGPTQPVLHEETARHEEGNQIPRSRVGLEVSGPQLENGNQPECRSRAIGPQPAVPEAQRANDTPFLDPAVRQEPPPPGIPTQRANDKPILNPSCDADRPAVPAVRQLLPARDDALPLYVKEQGSFVGKDGDRVVVRHREAKLVSLPLIEVSQVSLFGNVQISAQALREIVDRGIPICHFSYGGWFHAMTCGHVQKNIELRIAQFAVAADPERSLALAKGFITAKIKNSRTMLRRHGTDEDKRDLAQLAESAEKAERANSAATLLGLEGMAAKTYFAGFSKILKGGVSFDMSGRNRRPPRDPVNAVLSFVYALLTKELTIAVRAVGFDPLLGFFHTPRYGRPSLALDLSEEFRPIIADSTAMMVINNGEVTASSFVSRAGAVALTESGRKAVIAAFERRMEQEIRHPIFGYKISYRRVLEVQARLLSRVVLGELTMYPGFCTR